MNFLELSDDFLIGDEGAIFEDIDIQDWKLQDFIEDMKHWAEVIPQHEKGYRELREILHQQYEGLAQWLTHFLLGETALARVLYSDYRLLELKPHADLSAASHDFITRHFYPRLGYIWKPIATTEEHLWAFHEYSLFRQQIKNTNSQEQRRSKTKTVSLLKNSISQNREWLTNIIEELEKPNSRKRLPVSAKNENIPDAKVKKQEVQKYVEELKKDPIPNIHKLIRFQSKAYIQICKDNNFAKHFKNYFYEWDIYRKSVRNSKYFQVVSLLPKGQPLYISRRCRPPKSRK